MHYINISASANQQRASSQPKGITGEDIGIFLLIPAFLHFCYIVFSFIAL